MLHKFDFCVKKDKVFLPYKAHRKFKNTHLKINNSFKIDGLRNLHYDKMNLHYLYGGRKKST
ncbi:hypothetical protein B0A79_01490 [Flavobacterium piscis]|uniref:Uncharacterized protein n=1 Tax=Flavobacterium piscis TaxID=1114874 RepID=A0ABX2XDW2_9FLAO|nr:hypothetical protein FLP_20825 [Flavobacterium piscis]OXG07898.1 hypothetical protein B0A79_01490 [Flavobacterium piscis]